MGDKKWNEVLEIVKKVYESLTKSTKVVIIVWLIMCALSVGQIKTLGFQEYIYTIFLGIVLFGGITQVITGWKKIVRLRQEFSVRSKTNIQETKALQKHYDKMEGHEFEHYCAELLRRNGFSDVEVTKGSGDQGIDIIACKDGIKYGVQCKCYASDIGNKAVQEAFAGRTYYNCHVAAVLTNRHFTKSAKELAEKNGILLWDREKLESFISANR